MDLNLNLELEQLVKSTSLVSFNELVNEVICGGKTLLTTGGYVALMSTSNATLGTRPDSYPKTYKAPKVDW
jgi:hypothetical protein